jgi:dTMP kinase
MRGRFITFEGIEGVGKSTQVQALARRLAGAGREVVTTREPGGTPLAERIRALVLGDAGEPVSAPAELLLMFAARAVHTDNLIRPALARGAWVLCDRYTDATFAYQGGGRGVPAADIAALAAVAARGVAPDLTFLLDAPVAVALARARKRTAAADRIESETHAFFERARDTYLARAQAEPGRIRRIDATLSEAEVAGAIWSEVAGLVSAR